MRGSYSFPARDWAFSSDEGKCFIAELLQIDPSFRLSSSQALRHPWIATQAAAHRMHVESGTLGVWRPGEGVKGGDDDEGVGKDEKEECRIREGVTRGACRWA